MAKLVCWEVPFCRADYPAVSVIVTWDEVQGETVQVIVAPDGTDKYPKYFVDFGKVQAFASLEEAGSPRDFSGIESLDERLCAFEYLDSPWLFS